MAKTKLWDIRNVLVTLKAYAVSLVLAVLWIPFMLILTLTEGQGRVIAVLIYLIVQIPLFGYLCRKFWGWK
jgi:hypothetical protein